MNRSTPLATFRHEALRYAGAEDFADRAVPIIADAVGASEPVLVALDAGRIALLQGRLGALAGAVRWTDIRRIGGNPARIIPLWRRFVAAYGGRTRLWGFGEPVWAGRTPAELEEAQRHEHLLNMAFADAAGFTLYCPYDTASLSAAVLREAGHSHPFFAGAADGCCLGGALPDAPRDSAELILDGVAAARVRAFLSEHADAHRLGSHLEHLIVAITALRDGLGRPGTRLRVWREAGAALAELDRLEPVVDPLTGREWPPPAGGARRGVWLANQLCDLVQLRSTAEGAVVRLRVGDPD